MTTSRRRVCIVAPVHPYRDIRVFQKEAKSLANAGYAVDLIAQASADLEEDGVKVTPAPRAKHRRERFLKLSQCALQALATNADIYHLHNPDTLPIGFLLKLLGKTVIYDTHEDFSQKILHKEWIPKLLRRPTAGIVTQLEVLGARLFDATLVTQEEQLARFGHDTVLLENPPITQGSLIERAYRHAETVHRDDSVFRPIYVGLISEDRGLFEMVSAMEFVNRTVSARLWLIGRMDSSTLLPRAQQMNGWRFVEYLGELPQHEAFAHVIRADAGLITLWNCGDYPLTSPNKLFEYQVFGKPFVASDFPKWRMFFPGVVSGKFVNERSPRAIADALITLAEDPNRAREMGQAGQRYLCEHYNWEQEQRKLLELYQSLLSRTRA